MIGNGRCIPGWEVVLGWGIVLEWEGVGYLGNV